MSEQIKFYTDTHIDKQVALQLRRSGVDVVRCEEVGMAEADDEAHLTYAATQDRIMLTFDKGINRRAFEWLADGRNHSGVFICKSHLQSGSGIGAIVKACLFHYEAVQMGAETLSELRNQVTWIE